MLTGMPEFAASSSSWTARVSTASRSSTPAPGRLRGHTFGGSRTARRTPFATRIELDARSSAPAAPRCRPRAPTRTGETVLTSDGDDHRWRLDGAPTPHLDGLIDVNLEHRPARTRCNAAHDLPGGRGRPARRRSTWGPSTLLGRTRLEQSYRRIDAHRFAYTAEPDFAAVLSTTPRVDRRLPGRRPAVRVIHPERYDPAG